MPENNFKMKNEHMRVTPVGHTESIRISQFISNVLGLPYSKDKTEKRTLHLFATMKRQILTDKRINYT